MRILIWLLRAIVFIALFGLAIKNSGVIDLRLYFNVIWQAPLSLVILGCFAVGTAVGATAGVTTLVRQRREIYRLQDELKTKNLSLMQQHDTASKRRSAVSVAAPKEPAGTLAASGPLPMQPPQDMI
jgi:putative membrane protein